MSVASARDSLRHSAEDQNASQYPTGFKLVLTMASLMLGITLMSLDSTIISVANPKISTQFRALDDVGWYGAAYLMTLTAATPIAANFYKYFNPKYIYLAFIAIFEGKLTKDFFSPKTNAFMILMMTLSSWIRRLCFRTLLTRIYYRQSHRRPRWCRTSPRSIWHFDLCVYT